MPLTIRPATLADLPAITAIYNEAGVGTTASYDLAPVTVAERTAVFQDKQRHGHPTLVAVLDGETVGFASYGNFRDKAGYNYTVEHSVYVKSGHRAAGVGRMLMTALIDYAKGHGVHVMIGVLDGSNETSIAFHERMGFLEVARMPEVGRKFGRWLDIVMMQLTFDGPDVR
ncbi:GNAT family N-acetyltransferase [Aestuariimicrobium soli]|uniref:GNAT family N-acetyltransferase n=1 Tax=Aestuariimicrobium soli TaxID=2035834 RepID=UPI003EB6CC34